MNTDLEEKIFEILKTVLNHQGVQVQEISIDQRLYDDGLGLDSLSMAQLSAMLERAFKSDPYMQGIVPQTVAELVNFYKNKP